MSSVYIYRYSSVLILATILIQCTNGQESKSNTQYCILNSGGIGICASIDNCSLEDLAKEGKNPATCDSDDFVCCPIPIANLLINSPSFATSMKKTTFQNTPSPPILINSPSFVTSTKKATLQNTPSPPINRMKPKAVLSKSSQKCMEYSKIKCSDSTSTPLIINGTKVTSVEHYPHMALLGYGDPEKPDNLTWQCGGTLISKQYILTAAHCLLGHDKTEPVVAHLGFLNKTNRHQFNTLQEFKIVERIKHPDRVEPRYYADIALLKLDRPAKLSKSVLPACLHESMDFPTSRAQATGWGDIDADTNTGSDSLMKVTLSILKHENCFSLYPTNRRLKDGIKQEQQFCAGEDQKDTCQGDSGGPLQIIGKDYCMHNIIGVTSFGQGCAIQPGVYTRVSHYVPWIESIVWP